MTTTERLSEQRRPVTLSAFKNRGRVRNSNTDVSNCGETAIGRVVVHNQFVPARYINQLGAEVARGEEADVNRVETLSERVNDAVYGAIGRMYDLTPEGVTPQAFFQRHMQIGDSTLRFLAEQINPADPIVSAPKGEYDHPADIVKELTDPTTDQLTRKYVTARLAFALTSAEMQGYYAGTEDALAYVDELVADKIIERPRTSGKIYTVHNNKTNTLRTTPGPEPESEIIDGVALDLHTLFAKPIEEDFHVKEHDLTGDFQHIGYTGDPEIGLVAVRSRIKAQETALLKPVREALRRSEQASTDEDLQKGDSILASDTKDLVGSTFVALEADDSYDPKVDSLIKKVISEMKAKYTHLTDEDFVVDNSTNNRPDSVSFTFQRLLVNNLPEIDGYYEMMFFGKDYFTYKYAVGEQQEGTPQPTGCAHYLYEGKRFFSTYNAINQPENAQEVEENMYASRALMLLMDNRVEIEDLEKEYAELLEYMSGPDIFNAGTFEPSGVVYSATD